MTRASKPLPDRRREPAPNTWWLWVLVLVFLLYWFFAVSLERVDVEPLVRPFWTAIVPTPVPQLVLFVIELFHWRVLRHLIPVVAGWMLARGAAVSLVQSLYQMPDRRTADDLLRRLQFGGVGEKPIDLKATMLAERQKFRLLRVGGPGRVKVAAAKVAVTEKNGHFQRVLGPGKHRLGRFEYVYALLDLHLQERMETDIELVTKDGIELAADLYLSYRISAGNEPATPANPYPYSETAVRSATYTQTVLPNGEISDWNRFPQSLARARLVHIVSRYSLDEILQLNGSANEPQPYLAIQSELTQQVRTALQARGLDLVTIYVARVDLPEAVTTQTIQYWQVDWETRRRLNEADGQAEALEEMEIARAEAEMTMIQAIVEGVQRARREGHPAKMSEIVALRLVDSLEQMARQSQKLQPLPDNLLYQLRNLRQDLLPEGETVTGDWSEEGDV